MEILLIEDDEMDQRIFAREARRRGHNVTFASSGQDALPLIDDVQLIVIDVGLPDAVDDTVIHIVDQLAQGKPVICYSGAPPEIDRQVFSKDDLTPLFARIDHLTP
jgi:CheY-like chemotaxis protein